MFQLTAARRRLVNVPSWHLRYMKFHLTAARRRLDQQRRRSHPYPCFNSQQPEGGWCFGGFCRRFLNRFNSQPPEGGWDVAVGGDVTRAEFQLTAARRRLAASWG